MARVVNQGVAIAYETLGEGDVVLLHHGLMDSRVTFRRTGIASRLAERHRVVLFDARGHGASDKPHEPDAYAMEAMVGDVLAILDELGVGAAHFVGYSLGGQVGWELARLAPDRLRSLVVGAAHPYAQSLEATRAIIAQTFGPLSAPLAALSRRLPEPLRGLHFFRNDPDALRACVARDRPDRSDVLARFDKPTLVFVGSRDGAADPAIRAAFALRRGHLAVVPGYDHLRLGWRMQVVLPAIEAFLDANR